MRYRRQFLNLRLCFRDWKNYIHRFRQVQAFYYRKHMNSMNNCFKGWALHSRQKKQEDEQQVACLRYLFHLRSTFQSFKRNFLVERFKKQSNLLQLEQLFQEVKQEYVRGMKKEIELEELSDQYMAYRGLRTFIRGVAISMQQSIARQEKTQQQIEENNVSQIKKQSIDNEMR